MNVGFDLDKIFINNPPFIPAKIIDRFYKSRLNGSLKYRIPSKFEQIIRIFSHYPFFRPPITKNIDFIKSLALENKNKYYLISSRFNFLKKRTSKLIQRYELDRIFNTMYFNYSDNQPHEFKNKIIEKLNLDIYVDDDLQLLRYLASNNSKTKFYWLNKKLNQELSSNLFAINNLSEIFN